MKLQVLAVVVGTMVLSGCQLTDNVKQSTQNKTVVAGQQVLLNKAYSINPDCTVRGTPNVTMVTQPQNGRLEIKAGMDYPNFPASNTHASCNTRRVAMTKMTYIPNPGYQGTDTATFRVIFPSGAERIERYDIRVR